MREKEDRTSYKCFLIKYIWKIYFYIHRNKRTGEYKRENTDITEYRCNGLWREVIVNAKKPANAIKPFGLE